MNPFRYGQIVKEDDFCHRPELEKKLASEIRRGQNLYIQGERRTGKTSLIFETVRKLRRHRIIYIDLLETKTSDGFIKRMVTGAVSIEQSSSLLNKIIQKLAYLRPVVSMDPISGLPTLTLDASVQLQPDSIPGILDLISSYRLKTRPLVVVIDEFQDILNLSNAGEVLAQLRSKIQFQSDIPFLFSGSIRNKMDTLFNDPDSAFFKSALPIEVGNLDKELFQTFISEKFSTGKRRISTSVQDQIFEICFNVAGDIQQFCGALWETTAHGDSISEEKIPVALQRIFAHETKGYETILKIVTGQQLKFLTGLARTDGFAPTSSVFLKQAGIPQASSAQAILKRLLDLKILFYYEKEYRFVNPFFRAWLLYKKL
jgi:uncharacterized protein